MSSKNTLNQISFWDLNIQEQREVLQGNNPDMLVGVFNSNLHQNTSVLGYTLETIPNMLACYPNQLEEWQIELPQDFWKWQIVIINLWSLRKGQIEVIAWNSNNLPSTKNPILLSPWVIEYYQDDENWKQYTQTVMRDWGQMNTSTWIIGLADANERTTTAWRNFSWYLLEDLEIENAEESPFLMQDASWKYVLVTHDHEYIDHLISSIQNFLKNKYLSPSDNNYKAVKTEFERKFKWVKYDDLWDILKWIIETNSFQEYSWEKWSISWLHESKVQLTEIDWDTDIGDFYVFHDTENNTIEYRDVRRITWFPKWLKSVWAKIPLRLFLESQNQSPSFKKIENIWRNGAWKAKLVPTIDDVAHKVNTLTHRPCLDIGRKLLLPPILKDWYELKKWQVTLNGIDEFLNNPDTEIIDWRILKYGDEYRLEIKIKKWLSDAGSSPYLGKEKYNYYHLSESVRK